MRKFTFLTLLFSISMVFSVFAQKGYVNPSAKYCEMLGYRYEIATVRDGGQVGIVHLPDGQKVNAWDFFKGKVAQDFSYGARYGYETETETIQENGYTIERAVCIRSTRGVQEKISLLDLMEMNGDKLIAYENRSLAETHSDAKVDPNFQVSRALPTSFDWRNKDGKAYIGAPRNQGTCGSCYSFGAAAVAEGTYNVATNSTDNNTADFSEAYIAWCLSKMPAYSSHFSGCNGADYDYMELQALVDVGICNESYYPYTTTETQNCPAAATNAPKTKFASWNRVPCLDIAAIKTAIMTYGVVDAAVYVSDAFSAYSGGVFSDASTSCTANPCYNTTTNHAISLVGWGNDPVKGDYWILRNSWGSTWGEGGYMKLAVTSARVACSVCYMTYASDNTTVPTLTTNTVSTITDNSAICGGNISSNGNATITASGLVYAKTTATTIATGTVVSTSPVTTSGSYSLTMSGLTAGTTYYVRSYATNSKGTSYGSERSFTTTGSTPIVYCASQGNSCNDEWIASVKVGTFTNTSTATKYSDFTSKSINMTAGTDYTVTLTPGFSGSAYSEYFKIWVDLNGDGDFDDASELIFDNGALSKTAVTGSVKIPTGTSSKSTRMRVSMRYNAAQTACEAFSYGEVEDYTVVIGAGIVDTQAPTAPTNLISAGITQTSFTLNWTASTDNIGVTGYDVYQNGTLKGSSTTTSFNVTGLTAGTTYSYTVKAKDLAGNISAASSALNVTTTSVAITYCASNGKNSSYEWIDLVKLAELNNVTGNDGGYKDYTAKVATIAIGSTERVTVSCGFKSSSYTEFWNVWIDYNHDGVFATSENIMAGSSSLATDIYADFNVPTNALLGNTRMRVSMKYDGNGTACESFAYGEVEDYTVNIVATKTSGNNNSSSDAIAIGDEAPLKVAEVYPNPTNGIINITLNGENNNAIQIYSEVGQLVKSFTANNRTTSVDLTDFSRGVYFIKIATEKGDETYKVVKL